jgi:hypothetical protein
MSRVVENSQKIEERAECICDICQQMKWQECDYGKLSHYCDQLILKLAEYDFPYMVKFESFDDGTKIPYINIAGVRTPLNVVNEYKDHIIDRISALKIHSRDMMSEMNIGKLEKERAELHMMVLASIGFQMMDMSRAARLYAKALEKYVEYCASKELSSDMEIETWENIIKLHGIEKVRKEFKCPREILEKWEEEHAKI